jgi:signal peptidase II
VKPGSPADAALPPPPADRPAARRPGPWLLLLGLTAAVLAADLGLKTWAFHEVAGRPLRLATRDGQPTVQTRVAQAGDWVQLVPRVQDAPASAIPPHPGQTVVPGLLDLRLTINTGAVFGRAQGGRWLFISVSVIALAVIGAVFARSPSRSWVLHVGLALVLAGALGNLYDRVRFAAVRDMLHMLPQTDLWPWIFNIADASLMVGVGLLLVRSFIVDRRRAREAADPTESP